ncbi:MAG: hypothetical protein ABSB35_17345 [Bryobacteraceae bacterium]|jgi:hypothetical protein
MLLGVIYGVNHHVILVSLRQFFADLLRDCGRSIPLWPVLLALPSFAKVDTPRLPGCDLVAVQFARQPGFWRYAIEVKPFVNRLARDIVSKLSKGDLEFDS